MRRSPKGFVAWAREVEAHLITALGRDEAARIARRFGRRRLEVLYRSRLFSPTRAYKYIMEIMSGTGFRSNPIFETLLAFKSWYRRVRDHLRKKHGRADADKLLRAMPRAELVKLHKQGKPPGEASEYVSTYSSASWYLNVRNYLSERYGKKEAVRVLREFGKKRLDTLYRSREFTPSRAVQYIIDSLVGAGFLANPLMMVVTNPERRKYSSNPVDIKYDPKTESYEVVRLNNNPGG